MENSAVAVECRLMEWCLLERATCRAGMDSVEGAVFLQPLLSSSVGRLYELAERQRRAHEVSTVI